MDTLKYKSWYGDSGLGFLLLTSHNGSYIETTKHEYENPYNYSAELLKNTGFNVTAEQLYKACENFDVNVSFDDIKSRGTGITVSNTPSALKGLNLYAHYLEYFNLKNIMPSMRFLQYGSHNIYSKIPQHGELLQRLIDYLNINWGIPQHLFFLHTTFDGTVPKEIPYLVEEHFYNIIGMHYRRFTHLLAKNVITVLEEKEISFYISGDMSNYASKLVSILKNSGADIKLIAETISAMVIKGIPQEHYPQYLNLPYMWRDKLLN